MANGGKITYTIGFNTDMSGLKKVQAALKELQNTSLTSGMFKSGIDSSELSKIKASAKEVEMALAKAFNPKTNTYNVKAFRNELEKSGKSAESILQEISKAGLAGNKFVTSTLNSLGQVNLQIKETTGLVAKLQKALSNVFTYQLSTSAYRAVVGAFSDAVNYTKELNRSLNDIRIVTGQSSANMDKFAKEANRAAQSLGVKTTDYTNASLIYFQQGLDENTVKKYTDVTLKAMNVTGQTAEQVSEELTAVWNGYKVATDEAEAYIDKLAAVAASSASDLEELATAMSKVAATASTVGVDIDDLTAQISTIVSVTRQAPESVGTALKTIYARIGDLKVDGTTDDGVALGQVSTQMQALGVDILDTTGNMREMSDVIEEVALKWQNWTAAQKQAAAIAMAGKRQYTMLMSLFENWDMHEKEMDIAANSLGTLNEQQEIYMTSLEAMQNKYQSTKEELYGNLFNDKAIETYYDILQKIVKEINNFLKSIGGIEGILNNVKGITFAIVANLAQKGINGAITNIQNRISNIQSIRNAQGANALQTGTYNTMYGKEAYAAVANLNSANLNRVIKGRMTAEEYNEINNQITQMAQNLDEEIFNNRNNLEKLSESFSNLRETANKEFSNIDIDKMSFKNILKDDQVDSFKLKLKEAFQISDADQLVARLGEIKREFGQGAMSSAISQANTQMKTFYQEVQNESVKALENIRSLENGTQEVNQIKLNLFDDNQKNLLKQAEESAKKLVQEEESLVEAKEKEKEIQAELGALLKKQEPLVKETAQGVKGGIGPATKAEIDRVKQGATNNLLKSIYQGKIGSRQKQNIIDLATGSTKGKGTMSDEQYNKVVRVIQAEKELEEVTKNLEKVEKNAAASTKDLEKAKQRVKDADVALKHATDDFKKSIQEEGKSLAKTEQAQKNIVSALVSLGWSEEDAKKKVDELTNSLNKQSLTKASETIQGIGQAVASVAMSFTMASNAGSVFASSTKNLTSIVSSLGMAASSVVPAIAKLVASGGTDVGSWLTLAGTVAGGIFGAVSQSERESNENAKVIFKNKIQQSQTLIDTYKEQKNSLEDLISSVKDLNEVYETSGIDTYKQSLYELFKQAGKTELALKALTITSTEQGEELLKQQVEQTDEELEYQYKKNLKAQKASLFAETGVSLSYEKWLEEKDTIKRKYEKASKESENGSDLYKSLYRGMAKQYSDLLSSDAVAKYEEYYEYTNQKAIKNIVNQYADTITDTKSLADAKKKIEKALIDIVPDDEERERIIKSAIVGMGSGKAGIWNLLDAKEYLQKSVKDKTGFEAFFDNIDQNTINFVNSNKEVLGSWAEATGKSLDEAKKHFQNYIKFTSRQGFSSAIKAQLDSGENFTNKFIEELYDKNREIATELLGSQNVLMGQSAKNRKTSIMAAISDNLDLLNRDQEQVIKELEEDTRSQEELNKKLLVDFNNFIDTQQLNSTRLGDKFHTGWDTPDNYKEYGINFSTIETRKDLIDAYLAATEEQQKKIRESTIFQEAGIDFSAVVPKYENYIKSIENSSKALTQLKSDLKNAEQQIFTNADAAKFFTEDIKALNSELNTIKNSYKTLSGVVDSYNETGVITLENLTSLAEMEPQYLSALQKTSNGYVVNTEMTKRLVKAKIMELAMDKALEIQKTVMSLINDEEKGKLQELTNAYINNSSEIKTNTELIYANTQEKIANALADKEITKTQAEYLTSLVKGGQAYLDMALKGVKDVDKNFDNFIGKTSTKTKQSLEEDLDNLSLVNQQLALVQHNLEKIQAITDKLTGDAYTANLQEQNKLLENQLTLEKTKLDIQKQETADNKATLAKYGGQFDQNGLLLNKNEILTKYFNKSNYDQIKKLVSDYEKNLTDLYSQEMTILKVKDSITANQIKLFKRSVEEALESNDIKKTVSNWNKKHANDSDYALKIGIDTDNLLINQDSMNVLQGQVKKVQAEIRKMAAGGISDVYGQDMAAAYKDIQELWKNLQSEYDSYIDNMKSAADEMKKAFDDETNTLSRMNKALEHNIKIIQLVDGTSSYGALQQFYNQKVENNQQTLASKQAQAEYWRQQMEIVGEDSPMYEAYRKNMLDAMEGVNDALETTIQSITDKYTNQINEYFDTLEKRLAGMSFDDLESQWELQKRIDESHLDTVNRAYQVQKLQYDYEKAMSGLNASNQAKMREYLKEELNHLNEKENLTQYDVDRAQKVLDIHKAEMELEEARNNKSAMNLVRNAQGNYTYQYTADADKVADAQQKLADAQNNLYNFDKDAAKKSTDNMLKIFKEYKRKVQDIRNNDALNAEEKEKQIADANTMYLQLMQIEDEKYADILTHLAESSGGTVVEITKNSVDKMIEAVRGEGGWEKTFNAAATTMIDKVKEQDTEIKKTCKNAKLNYEDLKKNGVDPLTTALGTLLTAQQKITEDAKNKLSTLNNTATAYQSQANAIQNIVTEIGNMLAKKDSIQKYYEDLGKSVEEYAGKIKKLNEGTNTNTEKDPPSGPDYSSYIQKAKVIDNMTTRDAMEAYNTLTGGKAVTASNAQEAANYLATIGIRTSDMAAYLGGKKFGQADLRKIQIHKLGSSYYLYDIEKDQYLSTPPIHAGEDGTYAYSTEQKAKDAYDNYFAKKLPGSTMANGTKTLLGEPTSSNASTYAAFLNEIKKKLKWYDTGGYTGNWNSSEGRLAMLHEKELVLNKQDTSNILLAVTAMREALAGAQSRMMSSFGNVAVPSMATTNNTANNNITINADFPNVTSSNEVVQAIHDLENYAAQQLAYRDI